MKIKRVVFFMALLAWLAVACVGAGAPASTSPASTLNLASEMVFKTPEEAITYYFEGLAQADARKILQACAINEMSEKFKFDRYTERLRALMPAFSQAPADYPLYVEANKLQLSSQILNRIKIFAYSLLSKEEVADGKVILMDDTERINNFMKDVDPKKLTRVELKKIDLPNKSLMSNAKYLENAAKLAGSYGADESTERVALFSFEGNDYYLGFTLLRYGDNWKISGQTSPLASTNTLGAPQRTTAEEFERLINGD
jgi:hypothetical protein